ncbi:ketoacyl-ACP synthase III [Streptomyces sp. NPDC012461]|jgi:3-oxoacyl-[acyl-carrier-protein] synthase-3|uniref:Ketoacyl-ACP synthase III n=2 Tax=unclassified Streptomyces TaxID=2593676 RepID=A0A6G3R354_9ACTN|nr:MULTISPECIES: ketoacyl-ACP synthase III [unclassified Streptomyces]MBM7089260.1 ketoacyl-ACP synthase III [Streptomyces sp. S12]NEA89867.1 ketoacyl-ACP synthase III [Streptomyces sp. SID14436]NEC78787.1 ketoacyl-ACP synthase III [Streptomyces sp. SID7958]NED22138.1 ketoacyl-ACP synthase III [Streptomyces sp. SID9913]
MDDETSLWRESGLRLSGFGHYYPRLLLENGSAEDPAGNAVDEAVIGRLDVRSRHVADEDETPAYMAVRAAHSALEQAGVTPDELDLVIVSNWTDRQFVPEWAPHTAHLLGAGRALAFDVCGACTGFVHGVQTAAAYFGTHSAWRHALVVSSERFSRRVRPGSKGELIVGDAAGAAVLSRGAEPDAGLWDSLLISDGSGRETVTAHPPNGWIKSSRELVSIAAASHADLAARMLARSGVKMDEIDWVVPHPGTGQLHAAVRERLSIPQERFVTNYEIRANTGSASVPIVLSEMARDGRLTPGDLCYTPTVGSGWYYGGLLFRV